MEKDFVLYVCPTCYRVCDDKGDCHEHAMVICHPGAPGSSRRKPVRDSYGVIHSRAPRWFLEATGWIQAEGRYTPWMGR